MELKTIDEFEDETRLLAKLGDDGFSLVLFGTKVADSKEFCKKSTKEVALDKALKQIEDKKYETVLILLTGTMNKLFTIQWEII